MPKLTTDPALLRAALVSAILEASKRLLNLGVPPEEIRLKGDGYTVTLLRDYPKEAEL